MLVENGKWKIYFRIPFMIYFVAKQKDAKAFCLVKKIFHPESGLYRWKSI